MGAEEAVNCAIPGHSHTAECVAEACVECGNEARYGFGGKWYCVVCWVKTEAWRPG